MNNKKSYKPQFLTLNKSILENKAKENTNIQTRTSPLSGSEPKYEPKRWNNNENIKYNHNCYSYALNAIASKRSGKPQPGYYSGYGQIQDNQYNCKHFLNRLKKDIPSMYLTNFQTPCKKGFYKSFLVLDDKEYDPDYHFYRQNPNGTWSHKPGRQDVVDYDASNQKIYNPHTANRKYSYFDYKKSCFFFCLNPLLARAHSKQINNSTF